MQSNTDPENDIRLILAAEDYSEEEFLSSHCFSSYDNSIILSLIAHGPVLLSGGRGYGKSALLKRAEYECRRKSTILGFYLSLRSIRLLRSRKAEYEKYLCEMISQKIREQFKDFPDVVFVNDLQESLVDLARGENKRIVLLFDDAAHIGRETDLTEFFDLFRTLSNNYISCKAAIYPGVTNFGDRFDVYNDANVIDITRDEHSPDFDSFFTGIIQKRYPNLLERVDLRNFPRFLGMAVLGNVRALIKVCNELTVTDDKISLSVIEKVFKEFAANYYYPLLEEVEPKLGKYEPLVKPCRELVDNVLFAEAGSKSLSFVIIHRELRRRYSKLFEILEYTGFISKREASLSMKSGGRGAKFALNLPVLLEHIPGNRLTEELYERWSNLGNAPYREAHELHAGHRKFATIEMPDLPEKDELSILSKPVNWLRKFKVYPNDLTESKIGILETKYGTIGQLVEATEDDLKELLSIGNKWAKRIKDAVFNVIWM